MKRLLSRFYSIFVIVFLLNGPASAADNNTIRIAIITDRTSSLRQSPLISFLEAKLSSKGSIQLLERVEIDRILEEQRMSLSGLLDRANLIKIGQILRADAFLMLSPEDVQSQEKQTGQLIRARFVDVKRGLRLLDMFEEINQNEIEGTADRIIKKITETLPKLQLPVDKAVLVGIIGTHRVQLGEQYQWLERVLPAMLSAGLGKEPRIIVLEREDLKTLQDEKLLTAGSDSKFFSSTVLIDGYLQRRDSKGLGLRLSIRQGHKETEEIEIPVEPNEPKLAVDSATEKIIKQVLNAPPSVSWQPKQEADEFLYEGSLLTKHKRFKEALSPLETAHALMPQDVRYTGAVFFNEWQAKIEVKGIYSDLELADLVSVLVRQIKTAYDTNVISRQDVVLTYGGPLGFARSVRGDNLGYFSRIESSSTEEVSRINRENRKIWIESIIKEANSVINTPMIPTTVSYVVWLSSNLLSAAWLSSDIPEEVIANLRKAANEYLMPPESGGKVKSYHKRLHWTHSLFIAIRIRTNIPEEWKKTHLGRNIEKFLKLYQEYLLELTKSNVPYIKFFAYARLAGPDISEAQMQEYYAQKAWETLINDMNYPNEPYEGNLRFQCVKPVREIMDGLNSYRSRDPKSRFEMYKNIYFPLIAQGDVNNLMLWAPEAKLRAFAGLDSSFATEAYRLLKEIENLYEKSAKTGNSEAAVALSKIRDASETFKTNPNLHVQYEQQNTYAYKTDLLLNKDEWNSPLRYYTSEYMRVFFDGRNFFTAFMQWTTKEYIFGLAEIDLEKKKVSHIWRADFPIKPEYRYQMGGIAIINDECFVAIKGVGLLIFPRNAEQKYTFYDKPKMITEKDGLPSLSLTSIASINNKLWIAYGDAGKESGLVIFDPKTKKTETVFCSSIKGDTLFEKGNPYRIINLTPVPAMICFLPLMEWTS